MKRILFVFVSLFALVTTALASDEAGWVMTTDSRDNYHGATMANGRIGIVTDAQPFEAREIVLAGVFDKAGWNDVSRVVRGPLFTNMELFIDGEKLTDNNLTGWNQKFDMRRASLTTHIRLKGKATLTYTLRALRHLPCVGLAVVEVTPEKNVKLKVANKYGIPEELHDLQTSYKDGDLRIFQLNARTRTEMHRVSASTIFMFDGQEADVNQCSDNQQDGIGFTVQLKKGETYRFALAGAVCSTADFLDPINESKRFATFAYKMSIDQLIKQHEAEWEKLWQSDIVIEGDEQSQLDVRHGLYQLYSCTRENFPVSIAPMGLSSSDGYNGHYFWDTEIWMYPPLLVMQPAHGRSLVDFRCNTLPQAESNAINHGYRGAMYPWEADTSGEECTPVWALTGTFEHHITADIGIALWQYYCVSGNKKWLKETAYPVMLRIAEFWVSRVEKNSDGSYSIKNVVGADEYAENVDDNAYTNAATKRVLYDIIAASRLLGETPNPVWKEIADNLLFTHNKDGVTMEYTGYDGRQIKQADVNMIAYPLNVLTDKESILRDIDYYFERMDPNGPAMSQAILAVLQARLGDPEEAYKMFKYSYERHVRPPFRVLSENANNNRVSFMTGVGGMLQAVIFGFGGLDITEEGIKQLPTQLPVHWKSLTLKGVGRDKQTFRVVNSNYKQKTN
ncbi:MAG: glycoside hydrolase family 65 protein [Bacteroides sp.]|nr:glycoside hydrolase family 65 protein [Bacteroides sp.]